MYYADLHCHNHNLSFYYLLLNRKEQERGRFHPWNIISSNMAKQVRGKRAGSYSQSDLVKQWNGNVRLTFNGLYPLEKGFVGFMEKPGNPLEYIQEAALGENSVIRDVLQSLVMRLPVELINFLQSDQYDYWQTLQQEYDFIGSRNNMLVRNDLHTPGLARQIFENDQRRRIRFRDSLDATGMYCIPENRTALEKTIGDPGCITMVLTIEGGHALNSAQLNAEEVCDKIRFIKSNWQFPVFFITLAHHFHNDLCGHARSFPPLTKLLLDQKRSRNGGFTEKGWAAVRELLAVDAQFLPDVSKGYRILIDVKHMAPASRVEYYAFLEKLKSVSGENIPVIASHVAWTGIGSLADLMKIETKLDAGTKIPDNGFNYWGINICAEDVAAIVRSEGLIGLSFDQRILFSDKGKDGIAPFVQNIMGLVKAAYQTAPEQAAHIWNAIALGTDFDGYIDPVNSFSTSLDFRKWKEFLIIALEDWERNTPDENENQLIKKKIKEKGVKNIIENWCMGNAASFVRKHYPEKKF